MSLSRRVDVKKQIEGGPSHFGEMTTFHPGTLEKVDAVSDPVEFVVNHSRYTCLNDQFGTIKTW